ncbi:MAG: hypothetical protein WBM44_06295, partial [Waterburya sp.]
PPKQDFDSQCRLRIYYLTFDKAVVIVSELANNPGKSIADTATQLIHLVCYRFGLAPYKVMWVEHFFSGYLKESETYDHVILTPGGITCQRVSQQYIENLLGCSL